MIEIAIVILCLLANALIAGAEMAFVAVSRPALRELVRQGHKKAEVLLRLRERPERTLAVMQIGITLVAEGIETVGELRVLTELGVSAGQGYLLGRPSVRPEDWANWNSKLDLDGLKRHRPGPDESRTVRQGNES